MTDDMMNLRSLVEKSADADLLREMTGFAAEKLMALEAASMTRRRKLSPTASRDELERELEALRSDVKRLQLEHDLLTKANELVKKDLGIDLRLLGNREKTLLLDALRDTYPLAELLIRLEFACSSYFTTADDSMQQLHSYIRWYNQHRVKLSLGGFSPAEYRRNLATAA
ncbi:Integrase core domain-containing protein [Rhizobium sp. NFR07]|nr:Integrase core domain-containing protein [Rhizobium sp. NFR07]